MTIISDLPALAYTDIADEADKAAHELAIAENGTTNTFRGSIEALILAGLASLVTATPEGSLAAAPGALAVDTANELLYVKLSGTGNTGWMLVSGGSGASDLTQTITATAHGLVSGDVGKPLVGTAIYDDTADEFPDGFLSSVEDVNTVKVVWYGLIQLADSLIETGASYDPTAGGDGPYVYWDESAGIYKAARPSDSDMQARELLYVTSVTGGVVTARILTWGPN